jgi:hypothetical protein
MAGKREPERFVDLDQISRPKIGKPASPDEGLDGTDLPAVVWRDSWERGAQTPISELFAVMGSEVLNCGVWTRRMISLVNGDLIVDCNTDPAH